MWIILILAIIVLFVWWRHHNSDPIRSIHNKAMRIFAHYAGLEMAAAKRDGREYDVSVPCQQMALDMCGADKKENVKVMISELQDELGAYFLEILSSGYVTTTPDLINRASVDKMCPQLVIANIIDNTYGRETASIYVLGLFTGKYK